MIKNIWNTSYSEEGEKLNHFKSQLCKLNESRIWILKKLLELKKIKTVLDVACGPGLDLEHFKTLTDSLPFKYTGIDFTPKFIEMNKLNFPDQKFELADIHSIPFKDGMFDAVYTRHSIEHAKNPQIALSEILRVSKKYVIIGWFRLMDAPNEYTVQTNQYGNYVMNTLNRTEFTDIVEQWGTIEDTFTIKHNECWLIKKIGVK